jgi:hypothetical protein
MATNVGSVDRALRLVVGAALVVAPLIDFMGLGANAAVAYPMMAVGGILALTTVFGMCPLYRIIGVSTKS